MAFKSHFVDSSCSTDLTEPFQSFCKQRGRGVGMQLFAGQMRTNCRRTQRRPRVASHLVNRMTSCGANWTLITDRINGKGQGQCSATSSPEMTWLGFNIVLQLCVCVFGHTWSHSHPKQLNQALHLFQWYYITSRWFVLQTGEKFGWEEIKLVALKDKEQSWVQRGGESAHCGGGTNNSEPRCQGDTASLTSLLSCCAF